MGAKEKLRVVLDTNVYISALALPGSKADELLLGAVEGRYELIVSTALLAELANVLERKFAWDRERIVTACREIADISIGVKPSQQLAVFKDEPDNRILECAVAGRADRIVTGDKQMLKIKKHENVHIVTLADFHHELILL